MKIMLDKLSQYLPDNFELSEFIPLALIVLAGLLVLALLGRVCFGKRSGLNHSVCSAIGILFVYAVTIIIYTFQPANLGRFLSPLPFVSLHEEYLLLFSFSGSEFPAICYQVLNMTILAFLANVIDSWIPAGKNVFHWLLLRFVTVALAMIAQLITTSLLTAYLPGLLVSYAPIILVVILLALVLMTALKVVLGLVLTAVNPIFGAVYAFFFSSLLGKMLGRAMVTTFLLSAVVWILEYMDFGIICISAAALAAYLPLVLILLVLWYVLWHLL